MTDLLSKMVRDRKEAAKFSDLPEEPPCPSFVTTIAASLSGTSLQFRGRIETPEGRGDVISK